jgi:signal transduction histidine kinase
MTGYYRNAVLARSLAGLDRGHLRLWLGLFFLALAVPTGILVGKAYSQLKWEAFHQHRVLAEEVARRIDDRLAELIRVEESRGFADYGFLVVAGDPSANFLQPSPLSRLPVSGDIPGLIGYFQVDTEGRLSTPFLPGPETRPGDYGIGAAALADRLALQTRIGKILAENRLVEPARPATEQRAGLGARRADDRVPSAAPKTALVEEEAAPSRVADEVLGYASRVFETPSQAAFDRLNAPRARREKKQEAVSGLGRVEDLKLDKRYHSPPVAQRSMPSTDLNPVAERKVRREQSLLPEPLERPAPPEPTRLAGEKERSAAALRITAFESEIDPFELSLLDSRQLVLFRKVWRDGQRYIQGMLIEQGPFLEGAVEGVFRASALSRASDLILAYRGQVAKAFRADAARGSSGGATDLEGALLYRARLSSPLNELELIFSLTRLPAGPGAAVVNWLAAILAAVLLGGFYLLYRLALGQVALARQQQDFVSAVSHELKTPLTSIRMYGEMLREGWADEAKKRSYYDFISRESERLTRLISNVLQLARMTRNELPVSLSQVTVDELMDLVRSKVASQVKRAGFSLSMHGEREIGARVLRVDLDLLAQVFINLVDNALKFSAKAEVKAIEISALPDRAGGVLLTVRDYGPGVPRDQMKKIFRLFYRSETELTRETLGTGIGLALVHQMALAMDGRVDVVNREPGAELRLHLPAADAT